ncbi:hypothetical protein FOZ61_000655 [Perkinsus olseni]|uniref:J domain-containing protein n=1 Tax=Perkinsus olseni TaxID=32597 RepID=A0A7J6KSQ5_PEROL|nr:hypothetical protein FOZ61_000655 [Perkinsus olseni]
MPCGLLRCYWSKMPPRTPRPSSSVSGSVSCSSSSSKIADYYSLLGVSSDASIDDIRHAFYDICRRYHPDKVTPKNTKENTNHSSNNNNNTDEMIKTMPGGDDDDDATLGKGTNTTSTTTTTTTTQEQQQHSQHSQQQHSALSSALEHWTAIQAAWKCLSNDTKRIIYDIRREGRMVTEDDSNRLLLLLKAQAKRDIDNMQHEYHRILKREKKRNGVIIIKAIFGNLTPKDGNQHHHHHQQQQQDDDYDDVGVEGPYIDVTLPLQCTVDTHKVILAAGLAKSDIPGFYNPIPLHLQQQYGRDADGTSMEAASLYVVYEFKGKLHEVTVNDTDPLWLPLKSHAIPQNGKLRGPRPRQPEEEVKEDDDGGVRGEDNNITVPPTPPEVGMKDKASFPSPPRSSLCQYRVLGYMYNTTKTWLSLYSNYDITSIIITTTSLATAATILALGWKWARKGSSSSTSITTLLGHR